jgi:hypothetical protein
VWAQGVYVWIMLPSMFNMVGPNLELSTVDKGQRALYQHCALQVCVCVARARACVCVCVQQWC